MLSSKYIVSYGTALLWLITGCAKKLDHRATEYYVESTTWMHPPMVVPRSSSDSPLRSSDTPSSYTPIDRALRLAQQSKQHESILNGYSVQLYKGASRQEANKLQEKAKKLGRTPILLVYKQPYYTLWAGFFTHPLLAYMKLRRLER